ncbi:MAG: alcohol dehydrogenase, partial [Bacteroidota bacterium]
IGNCIVFNHLEEYYPEGVRLFKEMRDYHDIDIPTGICSNLSEEEMETMIDIALGLVPLWENALGDNWEQIMTRDKLKALYQKM